LFFSVNPLGFHRSLIEWESKCNSEGKAIPVPKYHAMKAYWGSGNVAPRILWLRH